MTESLTLAVAQGPVDKEGPEARLDWLAQQLAGLAGRHVDILLLPELFLSGYNVGDKLLDWAEPVDGPMARRIAAMARRHAIAIHYGYPERASTGRYNSAQIFSKQGKPLGHHRKLVLPPGFESRFFLPGNECTLFELNGFRIATLICYDAEFPEAFRHVAAAGADLVLVPTALGAQWGPVARQVMPTRAFENGVFVAYANHAGSEGDMTYRGESCIIAPDCQELARAGRGEEILIARADLSRVAAARKRLPYLRDRNRLHL